MCWSEYKWFPSKAELVGNIPVLLEGDCKSFAAHWPDGTQQKLTEKWQQLPTEQVMAYKHALGKWNEFFIFAGNISQIPAVKEMFSSLL